MASKWKLSSIGNYRLSNVRLGQGAFACVELATHAILGKQVALKIIARNEIRDPYVKQNFHREASILSRLNHPNIVKLVEIVCTENIYCLVLEYLPHSNTFYEVLKNNGALSESLACTFSKQLVSGLSYLHSKNILHRDLKLDNILVDKDRTRCLLIDFGLSNSWIPGQEMKTFCGSAEYAAPELFHRDRNYGPGIDVWSFGIVLYAMTMGRLPFELSSEQPNIQSLIRKVSSGITSTQRREMCLRLSWDCHSLIQKCLELNPLTRISVKEITFDNWLTGGGSGRVDFPNPVLDQALLKDVAADLKKTLKIQLSEIEILSFVSKRPFRTTGGCFNLLVLQHLEQRQKLEDQPSVETESSQDQTSVETESSQDQTFNVYRDWQPPLLRKQATPTPKLSRIENIPAKGLQTQLGLKCQNSELQEQNDENVVNPTAAKPSKLPKFGTIGDCRKKRNQPLR